MLTFIQYVGLLANASLAQCDPSILSYFLSCQDFNFLFISNKEKNPYIIHSWLCKLCCFKEGTAINYWYMTLSCPVQTYTLYPGADH